jgi:transcriptional regulator with XRE-family HTH domain
LPSSIHAERYGAVVEVLARARALSGVTQVQLAARLGRPQSYVSKVENRERRLDVVEFHDWALALGCDPASLFRDVSEGLTAK